jgi:hypothetical protein
MDVAADVRFGVQPKRAANGRNGSKADLSREWLLWVESGPSIWTMGIQLAVIVGQTAQWEQSRPPTRLCR